MRIRRGGLFDMTKKRPAIVGTRQRTRPKKTPGYGGRARWRVPTTEVATACFGSSGIIFGGEFQYFE